MPENRWHVQRSPWVTLFTTVRLNITFCEPNGRNTRNSPLISDDNEELFDQPPPKLFQTHTYIHTYIHTYVYTYVHGYV